MAFASVFKNLLVVLLLYIFVAASVFAFRRRSNAQLLKIQMMQEEACKQKLLQEAQRADMANNAKTEERVQLLSSGQSGDKGRQGCDIS